MIIGLTSHRAKFDVIERAKTPTGGDVLADRLKSLRSQAASSSPLSAKNSPGSRETSGTHHPVNAQTPKGSHKTGIPASENDADGEDAMFATDDQALEEMLGNLDDVDDLDVDVKQVASEPPQASTEPKDEDVHALLEELSRAVPKDSELQGGTTAGEEQDTRSDDSDGEDMKRETDDVMARYRDEAEMESALDQSERNRKQSDQSPPGSDSEEEDDDDDNCPPGDLALPSVPTTGDDTPSQQCSKTTKGNPADLDDITARMAALRAPAHEDSFALPDVPTSKPSGKPVNRLTSRTAYTDDDMDSWCTVCLEDATLRCLGCDDDVYCARCWREMHVGPAAAFDDRTHRAVQFTRDRKKKNKKVALGAV